MGLGVRGSAIGIPGPTGGIKPAGLYQLVLSTTDSDTNDTEIISGIAFGDPIVRLSSGANFQVKVVDFLGIYKRGFASSATPSNEFRIGINGGVSTQIAFANYTGGNNTCATIQPCIISGASQLYTINSGDRRFRMRYDTFGGVGAVNCGNSFGATVLFKLLSGSILSVRSSHPQWPGISLKKLS